MKLLIDTCNKDLYIAIIQNDKTLIYEHKKDLKRKSDALPILFKEMIKKLNINTNDIKEIYVVNGPGSFMGIRAGVVFAKTMAYLLNINLYAIDNLTFISNGKNGVYYVDASGNKSYKGTIKNNDVKIELCDYEKDSIIDYKNIINNPSIYLSLFKKINDIIQFESLYIKEPQIGGAK